MVNIVYTSNLLAILYKLYRLLFREKISSCNVDMHPKSEHGISISVSKGLVTLLDQFLMSVSNAVRPIRARYFGER